MGDLLSPGVQVKEKDFTTIIPRVSSAIGGIGLFSTGGDFTSAPAGIPVLVTSESDLRNKFGNPTSLNATAWWTAANFLSYANKLYVYRVFDEEGGTNVQAGALAGSSMLIKSEEDLVEKKSDPANNASFAAMGKFLSRQFGTRGNALKCIMVDASTWAAFQAWETSVAATINGYNTSTNPKPLSNLFGNIAPSVTSGLLNRLTRNADRKSKNDEVYFIILDVTGAYSGTPMTVLEYHKNLSKLFDVTNETNENIYFIDYINRNSNYVYAISKPTGADITSGVKDKVWGSSFLDIADPTDTLVCASLTSYIGVTLTGGVDGNVVDDADIIKAYQSFADVEKIDVNLILTANYSPIIVNKAVEIAFNRKDAMVFISPNTGTGGNGPIMTNSEAAVIAYRDSLTGINDLNGSYAVIDSGWKYQYDSYRGTYIWVPLNGDIAGLVARTEQLTEPWFSPGGFNRGGINGAIKLNFNPNNAQRDLLYMHGINPVVSFPGQGVVLFGDKTCQTKPSAFDRINVRRLFIVLEKAISIAAKYSLFELNDRFTRSQFKAMVEPFLRLVQGRRGITDFLVVCDETNNTGEVIDRNEFIADIYIKPARSINFITLNFVATRTGVDFSTVVGG